MSDGRNAAPGKRLRSYARRRGRRLSPRRQRLLDELLPRLRLDPSDPRLSAPSALFSGAPREVCLEIGFGGGEHLAWQAAHHPQAGFIGCEPFLNGVARLLAAVEEQGLANILVHDGDGLDVLEALGEGTIARIFVLFPDPWPKARHAKRRLVRPETMAEFARVLADGGELRLASDIGDYVHRMLVEARARPELEWTAEGPRDWRERPADWPGTRYEAKAKRQGRRPVYLVFRRRPRARG